MKKTFLILLLLAGTALFGNVIFIKAPTVAGGGGGSLTLTFKEAQSSGSDLSTYTFSSADIGAAADRDYVIVAFGARATATSLNVSSVTIGGVSATQIAASELDDGGNSSSVSWYYADVTTGTTADVVLNLDQAAIRAGCDVYTIKNVNSMTAFDTATWFAASSSSTFNVDTDSPTGDSVILGVSLTKDGGVGWTELTENSDRNVEFITLSTASKAYSSSGTQTITVDPVPVNVGLQSALTIALK